MPTKQVLALQLGNAYLLLMFIGLFVLNTMREPRVVHAYVWALWLGDIGHIAVCSWNMGVYGLLDIQAWTPVIWGNIAVTILLFLSRSAYLAGFLGEDLSPQQDHIKKQTRKFDRQIRLTM